jgi:hypothetical protein
MPMALNKPQMVVGARQTKREIRSVGVIRVPCPVILMLYSENVHNEIQITIKINVKP